MKKSRLRSLLLSSAAGAAMVAAAGSANALEYQFGGVQVYFDTTVSAGVSARVSDRNDLFLPEGNGGPVESRADVLTFAGQATVASGGAPNQIVTLDSQNGTVGLPAGTFDPNDLGDNYDGSINTDDGRLNFDKWDLTSGVIKMTNDIQANWQNYTLFARVNSFYDAVLDSDSSFDRSAIGDGAKTDAARDIDLLDLYISADYNVGDLPLNLRLGRQVINWGEGTFILNGINTIAPLDVNAFRRPGAEIKEGLLPIWAAYGSIGLPYNLALEGFYQLEWEEIQLDRPGTPFADSDVVLEGSLLGGNQFAGSFIGGGPEAGGFLQRNCATPDGLSAALDAAYGAAGLTNKVCGGTNPYVDYTVGFPIGQNEQIRYALQGRADIPRVADREASDSGQYGVALRWYSEELNSTEFGFYFMNYHSRLPIASERVTFDPTASVYDSFLLVGQDAGASTRATNLGGCNGLGVGTFGALTAANDPAKLAFLNSIIVPDTNNVFAAAEAVVGGDAKALAHASVPVALGGAIQDNSLLELQILNCALAGAQAAATPGGTLMVDGTEVIAANNPFGPNGSVNLFLEYPEDIKLFGTSFNTTIGDWGVQGEFSFRPNQPLQLDTDQLTLAALGRTCLLDNLLGSDVFSGGVPAANIGALDNLQTIPNSTCGSQAPGTVSEVNGFVREEVLTAQIGTTATYTNSNPLIGFLGSDLGILVTEVGTMWVPDVPDEGDFSRQQLSNVCTAGTDLPLGSFLALDPRSGCRPTSFSWGYVLLGQLQYNNAFGTPITLNPTVAWQHDVAGNSPSPLSNYREGRKRVSLALNGSYQSSWRGGISYTNFFGNEKYSRDGDRDFVSVNLSYSF